MEHGDLTVTANLQELWNVVQEGEDHDGRDVEEAGECLEYITV